MLLGERSQLIVFGGTDITGYKTLAPGSTYVIVDYTQNPQPEPAYQWAATVTEFDGSTYDVRGFVYRTATQCFLPQAQVENVTLVLTGRLAAARNPETG